jgi:hypothetical protein
LPLALDATSSSDIVVIRRNNVLEEIGYDTGMIFVDTDKDVAWERIQKRTRKVDLQSFEKYYNEIAQVKPYLKSRFPFFIEVKNSGGELTDEVVLESFRKVTNFYEEPIKNPIGANTYKKMRDNGWKYLTPNIMSMERLKKEITSGWYTGG